MTWKSLGKCQRPWKERLQINKIAKFKRALLTTEEVIVPLSLEILQTYVRWGHKLAPAIQTYKIFANSRSYISARLRRITFKLAHINSWKNRGIVSQKKRTRLSGHGVWVLGLFWLTRFVLQATTPNNKRMATSFFVSNISFFAFVKALSIVSTLSSSFFCSSWRISKSCRTFQLIIITKILVNGPCSYN